MDATHSINETLPDVIVTWDPSKVARLAFQASSVKESHAVESVISVIEFQFQIITHVHRHTNYFRRGGYFVFTLYICLQIIITFHDIS